LSISHIDPHNAMAQRRQDSTATQAPVRPRARAAYRTLSMGLVCGVLLQVYLAGAGIFAGSGWLAAHGALALVLFLAAVVLLILSFVARLEGPVKGLSALLVLLIMLQWFFIYGARGLNLPLLKAVHPVNALFIFLLPTYLWMRTKTQPGQ
jgi:hypothetical protein